MSKAYAELGIVSDLHSAVYPHRLEVTADIHGPSKTRQEFTAECDINGIMARYEAAGVWPFRDEVQPTYYDFTSVPTTLQGAMEQMLSAEEAFMRLPALVRKEFDNDAVRFVEFAALPDNLKRMREWGLAEPEKVPDAPMRVEVVNPAPSIVPAPGAAAPAP